MAKPKKNFYAIKYGVDPNTKTPVKNIILTTWAETETYVKGVGKSEYSGFVTLPEAEEYLGTKDPPMNIKDGLLPQGYLHCYVDGSYNGDIPNYSYGLVCVNDDKEVYHSNGVGNNKEAISMQQIGGELLGAINSLLFAKLNGYKQVAIIHDYKGVVYHATGYWERTNKFSEDYYKWMQNFFKQNPDIKVIFCKVDAHEGQDWNEIADGLAKMALGIKPDAIFFRMIQKHNIIV